jgi:glycosyltransferase involved in cell wall biosynthesis
MLFANRITVQFDSYKYKYPKFLRHKIVTIPNSIASNSTIQSISKVDFPEFVYAGRFSFQKQLKKLIRAFVAYKDLGGNGNLALYGEGEAS